MLDPMPLSSGESTESPKTYKRKVYACIYIIIYTIHDCHNYYMHLYIRTFHMITGENYILIYIFIILIFFFKKMTIVYYSILSQYF